MSAIEIPAGSGRAVRLAPGASVMLTNTHGSQVVDTWCLSATDTSEYLSVEHTRRMLLRLFPKEGDALFSNRRRPLLLLEKDTSGCRHDMLLACCDSWLYRHYGCPPGHANCSDNYLAALRDMGIEAPQVPSPVNFWMNVPVSDNERILLQTPTSRAGDYLVLRAIEEVYVVFSACPMDVTPINGADRTPKSVAFELRTR